MIKNFFGHLKTVTVHRWLVLVYCTRCGMFFRGLKHDLSKFSPSEFFESVKYYSGKRSPVSVCRDETGMTKAWLHHKGRNKHHFEYWYDSECKVQPLMPYKYAVECVCDKLAASRTYKNSSPFDHWQKEKIRRQGTLNPKTEAFMDKVMLDLKEHGTKFILNKKYMKKTYKEICE